jgi:hypothetical protein
MKRALSGSDIYRYAKRLKLRNFRGVYMLDTLPKGGPWKNELSVVNLQRSSGKGTHWVAFAKHSNLVHYFDSFGNLPPPPELIMYWKIRGRRMRVQYNYKRKQPFNSVHCGSLCLRFLVSQNRNVNKRKRVVSAQRTHR